MDTETVTRPSIEALRKISAGVKNRLLVRTSPDGQMLGNIIGDTSQQCSDPFTAFCLESGRSRHFFRLQLDPRWLVAWMRL